MERDEYDAEGERLLKDPPEFVFEVMVDGVAHARLFGEAPRRNWILWRVSRYVLDLIDDHAVDVNRYRNGKWENCDDWRKLGN